MEREKAYGNHDEPVLFLDQFLYEGKKILYAGIYGLCWQFILFPIYEFGRTS